MTDPEILSHGTILGNKSSWGTRFTFKSFSILYS